MKKALHQSLELEYKFKIGKSKKKEILSKLNGLQFISRTTIRDSYFDTPEFKWFLNAIFIRIRNNEKLEFKFNLKKEIKHTRSFHYSFPIPFDRISQAELFRLCRMLKFNYPHQQFNLHNFLKINGWKPFVKIKKKTEKYALGRLTFVFDRVAGLGLFLEIEITEGVTSLGKEEKHIKQIANLFHLVPIPTGYVELMLAVKHPGLYRRGQYLLPKDRQNDE